MNRIVKPLEALICCHENARFPFLLIFKNGFTIKRAERSTGNCSRSLIFRTNLWKGVCFKTSEILQVSLILTFAFLFKFLEILFFFLQMEKCAIFWEIKHLNVILFSTECILLCSAHIKCLFYFSLFIPTALKWTDPKNVQNRSSSLGPWHLNLMDNLKNVFTSRIFSRFDVTAVRTIFLDPLISWQN